MKTKKVSIFYSYSHKDESLRDALETHLSILSKKGLIEQWHDRRIIPGQEWKMEIDKNIEKAEVILLLVSPDFMSSDYCYGKELTRAIGKHEENQSIVIPVIIRPVDWSDAPFAKLQALPKDALAVTSWSNPDEAWLNVAKGIREAIEQIAKIKQRHGEFTNIKSIRELLHNEFERIDTAHRETVEEEKCGGIATGLRDLDKITDGLHPSELVVIASRPSMEKTDLAIGIAAHIAVNEKQPVAFFSLNLTAGQVTRRLVSSIANVSSYKLLRGSMHDDDWIRLSISVGTIADAPLFIDVSTSLSLSVISDRVKGLNKKLGLKLIVIDSIQHLAFQMHSTRKEETIYFFSKSLKNLAKELQIPVVATSTLIQSVERRPNKRPIFLDLGAWKSLEDDADIIIFVYRQEVYDREKIDKGTAELIIAKNANGPVGTIRTVYLPEYSSFKNYHPDPDDFRLI